MIRNSIYFVMSNLIHLSLWYCFQTSITRSSACFSNILKTGYTSGSNLPTVSKNITVFLWEPAKIRLVTQVWISCQSNYVSTQCYIASGSLWWRKEYIRTVITVESFGVLKRAMTKYDIIHNNLLWHWWSRASTWSDLYTHS